MAAFCASAVAQQVPAGWALEVVIADGHSDDGTRALLDALAANDLRLHVIDNPQRIVSAGLNRALTAARGEVIVRMDVHTVYAPDYIAECLAALAETGADNVGGPWCAQAEAGAGATQRAVAAAFQSRWVAGGALSRDVNHSGWVDTVYLGAWPRATFERYGRFDEALVRNQDDEHNLRLTRAGARVWQSARIRSAYRPRAGIGQVFQQYLQYGYWKPFVMKKHGQPAAVRQVLPGAYVALLVLLAALALVTQKWLPLAALLALYAFALAALGLTVAASATRGWSLLLRLPAVIAAYHLGYGIGTLVGWWDVLRHGHGRARFAKLTR